MTIDQKNTIHVVWPTLIPGSAGAEETMALFYATSTDGRRFTKRQQIPTEGVPRHPQLAVGPGGTIAVAWDEQLKGTRRVIMATGTTDNKNSVRFARQVLSDAPGTYPVLASLVDGVIVAWTSGTDRDSVLRVMRHPAGR